MLDLVTTVPRRRSSAGAAAGRRWAAAMGEPRGGVRGCSRAPSLAAPLSALAEARVPAIITAVRPEGA